MSRSTSNPRLFYFFRVQFIYIYFLLYFYPLPFSPLTPPTITILLFLSMSPFSFFSQSFHSLLLPPLTVLLLSIYESVSTLLVCAVCSIDTTLLGTALPGFRSCNPPWLRLSERPWDHKPLRRKAYLPGRGATSTHFALPCLALSLTS